MAYTTCDNNYGTARFIVGSSGQANYLTIASAIAAAPANSTIFLLPGTYTEDITLALGKNLAAYDCDALTPNVTIVGKISVTSATTVTISGIRLQTNSDFLLAVTGTLASIVNLKDCYINASNNSAISFTSSSASSRINIYTCRGNLGAAAINYITHSGAGDINIFHSFFSNTASSTTASTISGSGGWQMYYTTFSNVITSSSTSNGFTFVKCHIDCGGQNTTVITHGCTNAAGATIIDSWIASGTASAISVSASCLLTLTNCTVNSSNTNAVTGAGTINYTSIKFSGTSSLMNTTTQTPYYTNHGKFKASGQPCFLSFLPSVATDVTGDGTNFTIGSGTALTEVFDLDSNFSTATFTAPVTGKYLLIANALAQQATTAMDEQLNIATSNATYAFCNMKAQSGNNGLSCSVVCDMDAADTATMTTTYSGGTKVVDIFGGASDRRTCFSGFLIA